MGQLRNGFGVFLHGQPAFKVLVLVVLDHLPFELEEEPPLAEGEPFQDVEDLERDVELFLGVSDDHVCVLVGPNQVGVLVSADRTFDPKQEMLAGGRKQSILKLEGRSHILLDDLSCQAIAGLRFFQPNDVLRAPETPLLEKLPADMQPLDVLATAQKNEARRISQNA